MHFSRRRFAAAGVIAVVLLATVACEETGDVQVSSIHFRGNSAIDAASLKGVIATRAGGLLPWSRKRFFDRTEFDRDVQRINLAERAGARAVGYLASPLANSIADALDLDIFEIRTGDGGGQPSVALGQQFGSRLFVSFRQEFGSSERRELALEYRINELLRLVSTVTQGSRQSNGMQRVDTTGVDLIYVLSY